MGRLSLSIVILPADAVIASANPSEGRQSTSGVAKIGSITRLRGGYMLLRRGVYRLLRSVQILTLRQFVNTQESEEFQKPVGHEVAWDPRFVV